MSNNKRGNNQPKKVVVNKTNSKANYRQTNFDYIQEHPFLENVNLLSVDQRADGSIDIALPDNACYNEDDFFDVRDELAKKGVGYV